MLGTPTQHPPQTVGYERTLSLFDATMLVIGGIVGAGIFLNPAVVAQRVPTGGMAVGVWALGGAVALAGALCFAELGARRPLAGGGYVYLRDAFGLLPGFLYGWTQLLVINSGGIAAVAVTFARYAAALGGAEGVDPTPIAVASIVVLSAVNYFGIRPGAVVQNVLTVLKVTALVGLIAAGFLLPAGAAHPAVTASDAGVWTATRAVGVAMIPVLFAYGGWQSTNFVAEELTHPQRDLPRAIVLGVVGVVVLYVLTNLVYVNVLGLDGLASSAAPAADVMQRLAGPRGAVLISAGVAVSTFGFLNLAILASPRMYRAMAGDGVFFGAAAALHRRHHVPSVALIIQAAWAILLVTSKTYGQLLDYVVFGDWIFFGLVGATLFVYRRRDRNGARGFRTPGYPMVPLFFVVVATFVVVSTVVSNPGNAALGGAIILGGVPAYATWRRRARRDGRER